MCGLRLRYGPAPHATQIRCAPPDQALPANSACARSSAGEQPFSCSRVTPAALRSSVSTQPPRSAAADGCISAERSAGHARQRPLKRARLAAPRAASPSAQGSISTELRSLPPVAGPRSHRRRKGRRSDRVRGRQTRWRRCRYNRRNPSPGQGWLFASRSRCLTYSSKHGLCLHPPPAGVPRQPRPVQQFSALSQVLRQAGNREERLFLTEKLCGVCLTR